MNSPLVRVQIRMYHYYTWVYCYTHTTFSWKSSLHCLASHVPYANPYAKYSHQPNGEKILITSIKMRAACMAKMGQEQTIERYFVGAVLKQRKGAVKWYGIDICFFSCWKSHFIAEFRSNITTKTLCQKKGAKTCCNHSMILLGTLTCPLKSKQSHFRVDISLFRGLYLIILNTKTIFKNGWDQRSLHWKESSRACKKRSQGVNGFLGFNGSLLQASWGEKLVRLNETLYLGWDDPTFNRESL